MDDADRPNAKEPMFYLIHGLRAGYDDFTVEGVLSLKADADAWVKELEALPYMVAVAPPQHVPLRTVVDLLMQDRWGRYPEKLVEG